MTVAERAPAQGRPAAALRRVQAAWRATLVVAAIVAAGLALGLPWWVVGLAAFYVASIAPSAGAMRATYAAWDARSREWSRLLEEGEVGRGLHDMAGSARPAARHAIDVLERCDARAGAEARDRLDAVYKRTDRRMERWRKPPEEWVWPAVTEGYLGGQRFVRLPGSRVLVRYFAIYENTPGWLPRAVRRRAVPILRLVDVVRLLHNDDIERRSLIATLWVRAAVLATAPLTASASPTGLVPLRDGSAVAANAVYAAAVVAAVAMALLGPRIARYTMHRDTRWWLYACEQALTIAAVVAAPCWAVAIYGSGAVNWLQRPHWRLRRLFAWMAATYIPFAVAAAAAGAAGWAIGAEAAIAIAATAIMAGSYGLMAPVTAVTLLRALVDSVAWRVRVWRVIRVERRELRAVIAAVETQLRAYGAGSAEAAGAAAQARAAGELLAARGATLRRRPRNLARLLEAAIGRVVVPDHVALADGMPEPRLRSAGVVFRPGALASLTVAGGRNARRIEALVVRIVQEAVDKGAEGLVHTYVRDAGDGAIEIEICNDVPEQPLAGFGTGAQWLERARVGIPDARAVTRGRWTSDHHTLVGDVYSVVVRLGPLVFEKRP
jgi:hypothetical protein